MWNNPRVLLALLLFAAVLNVVGASALLKSHYSSASAAALEAAATEASSTPSVADVLAGLQNQVANLTDLTNHIQSEIAVSNTKTIFTRSLARGDSGDDVKALQTILAPSGATSTPTGFYGSATEQEVRDFQKQAGIKVTGTFDPKTRDALLAPLGSGLGSDPQTAPFAPLDLSGIMAEPSGADVSNELAKLSVAVSDLQSSFNDLANRVAALESTGADASAPPTVSAAPVVVNTPPPPPTLPTLTISSLQATTITKNSAIITWTTNNQANNEVDYSTSSGLSSSITNLSPSMLTSHSMTITGLTLSTKYYYHVTSTDASGGTATSPILSFTTPSH